MTADQDTPTLTVGALCVPLLDRLVDGVLFDGPGELESDGKALSVGGRTRSYSGNPGVLITITRTK